MEYTLIATEQSTAKYLGYELENLGRSIPLTVERNGDTVKAVCKEVFERYLADELKSLLCRWFDFRAKVAYLKERLPNPGLDAAVYEAYVQSLALIRENYGVQERLPLSVQADVEALFAWYREEIRGEWDKIVASADLYSISDDLMAIRFVRKLRREIPPYRSYVKLTIRDDGYEFSDHAGKKLDFIKQTSPFGMITDSIRLNASRLEVESKLTHGLPLADLVRDVNPNMALSHALDTVE